MKFISFIGLFVFVSATQAAPIFCGAENSKYQIVVSNNLKTATVKIEGVVPQFGNLVCNQVRNEGEVRFGFLTCQSPFVADAGFEATFTRGTDPYSSDVKLEEFWIGGTHPRAQLHCVHAIN